MMSFFTMTIPTLHTLLRCWLAVSKSIAAKSWVSPKNRLYRLTCLYNCLLLPHETVGSIKNGVS